jgi:hypothetical protein
MTGTLILTVSDPPEVLASPAIVVLSTILQDREGNYDTISSLRSADAMDIPRLSIRRFRGEQLETDFALWKYIQRKIWVRLRYGS